MPWNDLLSPDRIVMLVEPGTRASVLDAAARLLGGASPTITPLISQALRDREALGSTGIGRGVAIPHARCQAFNQSRGAFLRLDHPVDFGASDGVPVDLVFAMCSPEGLVEDHLQQLSWVAERFSDPELREALRAAGQVAQLRSLLLDRAVAGIQIA